MKDISKAKPLMRIGNWHETVGGDWIYLIDYPEIEPRILSDEEQKCCNAIFNSMSEIVKEYNIKFMVNGKTF